MCLTLHCQSRWEVSNLRRIAAIHEGSRASHWKYVDTSSNPADDASRGLSMKSCVEANGGFVALTFCGRKNRLGLNSRML